MLVVADRGGAVALGELLSVGAVDHRQVREARDRRAERFVEEDLLGRIRDVIVAAHHEGDPHRDVIGDHGVVVDRCAVGAEDDEVVDIPVGEGDPVVYEVLPRRLAVGDPEADDRGFAGGGALLGLGGGDTPAAPVVAEGLLPRLGLLAARVELGGGAEAAVRFARGEELGGVGLMPHYVRTLEDDLLVPVEAEPVQAVEDRLGGLVAGAGLVGVLDAEKELAAGAAGEEPVEERRARAADVEVAGGGGGEAEAERGLFGGHRVAREGKQRGPGR